MYAHQVIEDLRYGPQMVSARGIDFVISRINESSKFHVGDWKGFIDFLPEKTFAEMVSNELEAIKMPYAQTYIDGEMTIRFKHHLKSKIKISDGKFAFLFESFEDLIIAYAFYYKPAWNDTPEKYWMLWPTHFLYSIGKRFKDQDREALISIGLHGKDQDFLNGDCIERSLPIDIKKYPGMTTEYFTNVIVPGINETSTQTLSDVGKTICTFCSFLSCKNITTINNPPPEKLNKKRAKKGKCPLFIYKTLVIKPTGKKQASQEAQGLWENRVHLCRGHFKTYTEENPLFGKFTGRYWWQPSVRGNKKKGVVMKDYKVEASS